MLPAGGKATAPPPVRPSSLLWPVLVVAVAALCVRLGFWQISRLHEKQALNTGLRSELAGRPIRLGEISAPVDSLRGRKLEMRGRFDERRQILLAGRAHDGAPGVDVVTPLLLGDGTHAVLVDRGWLYAADGATARPQDYPEPGERAVLGTADSLRRGAGGPPLRSIPGDSIQLLSARWLDLDSLAPRFPYALAPVVLRELPGPGVPEKPLRRPPRPLDEFMHVSYAIQWFTFAAILLGGSAAVARSRRRGAGPAVPGRID